MLSAKIDTSVKPVNSRSTAIAPRTAITPTTKGSSAATRPPKTHTSTRHRDGFHPHQIVFGLLVDLLHHHRTAAGPN